MPRRWGIPWVRVTPADLCSQCLHSLLATQARDNRRCSGDLDRSPKSLPSPPLGKLRCAPFRAYAALPPVSPVSVHPGQLHSDPAHPDQAWAIWSGRIQASLARRYPASWPDSPARIPARSLAPKPVPSRAPGQMAWKATVPARKLCMKQRTKRNLPPRMGFQKI
jgi:hypothetical protein